MITRRSVAAACIAGTLALPAAASAMPLDNSRVVPPKSEAPPSAVPRTIVQTTDDTIPIALAGAALLVAMASAGYTTLTRTTLRTDAPG